MQWEPEIEYYCRWSMQVDLYLKYKLFADDIREATEGVKLVTRGPQSLLDKINTDEQGVFAFEEVLRVYTAEGKGNDEKKIRNTLSQWKTRGFLEDLPGGRYKKIKARNDK
jgi:hypothetical protein